MAITYPLTDLVAQGRFQAGHLRIRWRQERSITAGGVTIGKDLGPALWVGQFQTRPYKTDEAMAIEAQLASLDGVIGTFEAYDVRRARPANASAGFSDAGVTISGTPTASALALAGLPAGFQVAVGDHLAFTYAGKRALHQAVEAATADGTGVTPAFEVRPYIRVGATAGLAVSLVQASGVFALDVDGVSEPQQIEPGIYRISWTATQVID